MASSMMSTPFCSSRRPMKPKRGTEDDDEELAREATAEEGGGGVCAVMEEKCWLRCMECKKWRCVEPACAEVLRGTSYFGVRATDLDWASWLGEAQQRYAAAVSSHESALEAHEEAAAAVGAASVVSCQGFG